MSSINITNHFHAPIGQHIDHVDKIVAHFDKDMGMHIEMGTPPDPLSEGGKVKGEGSREANRDDIGGNGQSEMPPQEAARRTCWGGERKIPKENSYKEVVDWLEEEKAAGRDWYKMNDNNRSAMCRQLTCILGWVVDQNSLRKAGG